MNQELDMHCPSEIESQSSYVHTTGTFESLLDSHEAARKLGGIHVKTLQRWVRLGRVVAHKIGRSWFFRASELDEFVRRNVGFYQANNARAN